LRIILLPCQRARVCILNQRFCLPHSFTTFFSSICVMLYNFLFSDLCNALDGVFLPLQTGRFLSLLSLITIVLCLLFLGKRSGSVGVGFLASFFYLISSEVSGGWCDLARVDSMLNALLALCLVLITRDKFENIHALLMGVLLFVAFLAK